MKAYISIADETTGFTFNVQIVKDGIYTTQSKYFNDLFDAFDYAEQLGCTSIYTTF